MNFRVGQKVVSIPRPDDVPSNDSILIKDINVGIVLTIRDIDHRAVGRFGHDVPTLRFEEIVNIVIRTVIGPWEGGYDPRCFRPVVERKTDISVFTKILDDVRAPIAVTE